MSGPKRNALMDFAQSASNAVAQGVSGPVDLIAAGLRYAGVPVPRNALMSSEWMAQQGLTRPVEQGAARVLGETAGMVAPTAIAANAARLAAGANQMMANTAAPVAMGPAAAQRGGVNLAPFGQGPHYRVDDLSRYTDDVYRQTTVDQAEMFMPGSNTMTSQQDLWFANLPEYALGQRGNTGAMLRFNTQGMPGQLSLLKPNAAQSYQSGMAEFITRDAYPSDLAKHLMSITIDPGQSGPYMRRIRNLAAKSGWKETKAADGRITFAPD